MLLLLFAGKLSEKDIVFGTSEEFVESAAQALEGKIFKPNANLCDSLEAAKEVASCGYEYGTAWGKQVHNRNSIFKGDKLVYIKMVTTKI